MSSRKIFEYRCGNSHVTEALEYDTVQQRTCEVCGEVAIKIISTPAFHLPGYDPSYGTTWDRWARDQEARVRKAKQVYIDHGEEI